MVVVGIKRRGDYTDDYHCRGSKVLVELSYSELATLDNALFKEIEREEKEKTISEETLKKDKFFKWQFGALRDIVKEGVVSSWVGESFLVHCRPKLWEQDKKEKLEEWKNEHNSSN